MNFISGRVEAGSFRVVANQGGENGSTTIAPIEVGRAVPDGGAELGVRPEDISILDKGSSLGRVSLDVVEHMGHETIAHFTLAGDQHVARLPADAAVAPGDELQLYILPGAYHLFAVDDGRRLN
jgi:multiple sugar transport system ATP-binding protein